MSPIDDEGAPVNILLVDDRPANLSSLQGVLNRADYNVMTAASGLEALHLVLHHELAVILLDVAMPGMDGFEVAATIKQRERFRSIPIIFVTASIDHIEWIFRAYSVGAVDFLSKPLDPHAVRAKVAVFVELFRQKQRIQQQAAQLSELRVRNLAEALPHIVWTARADGHFDYFNRRWYDVTGLDDGRSLGLGWLAAVHPEDEPSMRERWERAVHEAGASTCEFRLRQADGSWRWQMCRALVEQQDAGDDRWFGTFTDVEEERRAHQATLAAVRLRDEFLSVASHELRTPLSALQLQIESAHRLLERSPADSNAPRLATKLGSAIRQTRRLERLISMLLDVSRMVSGGLVLVCEPIDLAEVVREVADRFKEEAERAGCALLLELAPPVVGRWDRVRLEQVLTNLLSNALKYAAGTPIEIRLAADGEHARLAVTDRGIGIAPEHIDRIFGRFERAVPAENYGGLGLGLYITRQIVEAHGGTIEAESEPERGAVFRVALPLHREDEDAPAAAAAAAPPSP